MKIKPTTAKDLNQIITAIPSFWRKQSSKQSQTKRLAVNIKIKSAIWQSLGKHS